jgi:hypothetical protein
LIREENGGNITKSTLQLIAAGRMGLGSEEQNIAKTLLSNESLLSELDGGNANSLKNAADGILGIFGKQQGNIDGNYSDSDIEAFLKTHPYN